MAHCKIINQLFVSKDLRDDEIPNFPSIDLNLIELKQHLLQLSGFIRTVLG
jgi:hypothetical protein